MHEIRKMMLEDLDSILSIDSEVNPDSWSVNHFISEIKSPAKSCSIVIINNSRIAGFSIGRLAGDQYELLLIAVSSKMQGKGFGKQLLKAQLKWACDNNASEGFLEVRVSNQRAICLYRTFGFTVIGERKKYYKDGETAALMKCDI